MRCGKRLRQDCHCRGHGVGSFTHPGRFEAEAATIDDLMPMLRKSVEPAPKDRLDRQREG